MTTKIAMSRATAIIITIVTQTTQIQMDLIITKQALKTFTVRFSTILIMCLL